MLIPQFTEEKRKEFRDLAENSLYFFAQGILRMPDLAEKPHLGICEALDGRGDWGPWRRGVVGASRGFLKSSICTVAFPLHRALYRPNWACRIIGANFENIKLNSNAKIRAYFESGAHADWLTWLYGDRIPEDFKGWNDRQIDFVRTDSLAFPSLTFRGMESAQESWHGECVLIDDPEGADAEKQLNVNVDAKRLIDNSVPLLKSINDQILLVDTSHGSDPLMYQLLEDDSGYWEKDNAKREWKYLFIPIVDGNGESNWPDKYKADDIAYLRATTTKRVWDSQFMLRKRVASDSLFDMSEVRKGFWKWKLVNRIIEYPTLEMDSERWYKKGEFDVKEKLCTIHIDQLRFYLHVDPKHRQDTIIRKATGTARPSKFAAVIVGVAPDNHAFVMHYLNADIGLEEQARQVYRYYCQYGCFTVTWDPVGAQVWFRDYAALLERSNPRFKFLETIGYMGMQKRLLPALTSRLVEDKRPVHQDKAEVIYDRLAPLLESRTLHLNQNQEELIQQGEGFPDNTDYVDLWDALAQGPPVWKPPLTREQVFAARSTNQKLLQGAQKYTGYRQPFSIPAKNVTPGDRNRRFDK